LATQNTPLLEAFQKSTQAGLPPVLTVPLKGMLIPDTLRSDHAPFWYQGSWRSAIDGYGEFAYALLPPGDTPATLDKPFFTGAAIVVNATTMLLESRDRLPTAIDFSRVIRSEILRYQLLAELPEMVAPLLKVLVLIETGTGREIARQHEVWYCLANSAALSTARSIVSTIS